MGLACRIAASRLWGYLARVGRLLNLTSSAAWRLRAAI